MSWKLQKKINMSMGNMFFLQKNFDEAGKEAIIKPTLQNSYRPRSRIPFCMTTRKVIAKITYYYREDYDGLPSDSISLEIPPSP